MPAILTGDPDQVQLGAGSLYVAAITQDDPASVAAVTGASAWREVGWTDDGSTLSFETTSENIMVEEEFYPVKVAVTEVTATVAFQMAQATRQNLALALNEGAAVPNNTSILEPVTPGSELRIKIVLITDAGALWIFRRCFQTGSIEINNQKAPDNKLIPVEFSLEKPSGAQPWGVIPNSAGLI